MEAETLEARISECWQGQMGGRAGVEGTRLTRTALLPPVDKATNPLNKELDWDGINAFCEQLNKELEG